MKKLFIIFLGLIVFSRSSMGAPETHEEGEYETRWSLGVASGSKPFVDDVYTDPRLYVNIETTRRGLSTPSWNARIYFKDRDPQILLPMIFKNNELYYVAAVVGGITGAVGSAIGERISIETARKVIADQVAKKIITEEVAALIAKDIGNNVVRTTLMGAAGGVATGVMLIFLVKNLSPFVLKPIKEWWHSKDIKDSKISIDYTFREERVDEEETKLFLDRTGSVLRNDYSEETIIRTPVIHYLNGGERRDAISTDLFSYTLDEPVVHMVDIYERIRGILTRQEGKSSLSLMFQVAGMSNNPSHYVRNWNSFAALVSARCFGVPLIRSPRLVDYIDDTVLGTKERWDNSKWPSYDRVIEGIIGSYAEVRTENPRFRMNRDFISYLGRAKDHWYSKSVILKKLEEIGDRA